MKKQIEEELTVISDDSLKALERWTKRRKVSARSQLSLAKIVLAIYREGHRQGLDDWR